MTYFFFKKGFLFKKNTRYYLKKNKKIRHLQISFASRKTRSQNSKFLIIKKNLKKKFILGRVSFMFRKFGFAF